MNWIEVKKDCQLPKNGEYVHVLVQNVSGGKLRDSYFLAIAMFGNTMMFSEHWDFEGNKSGIVRFWSSMNDMPEGFKQVSNSNYWEKKEVINK